MTNESLKKAFERMWQHTQNAIYNASIPTFDLTSLGDFTNYSVGREGAELYLAPYADASNLREQFQKSGIVKLKFIYKQEHEVILNLMDNSAEEDIVSGYISIAGITYAFTFFNNDIMMAVMNVPYLVEKPTSADAGKAITIDNNGEYVLSKLASSWNDLTDKPFGDGVSITIDPATFEPTDIIEQGDFILCSLTDQITTKEDVLGATLSGTMGGQNLSLQFTQDNITYEDDNILIAFIQYEDMELPIFVAAAAGTYTIQPASEPITITVPNKGFYTFAEVLEVFTSISLTKPAKKIDEKYLPNIPDTLADLTSDSNHRTVTDAEKTTWNAKATTTYVDQKVAGIVDSSPEALNTLNELAAALGNDPAFATTVATEIGKKVDKVPGKGLSTNDYTTAEKEKLAGLATVATSGNYNDLLDKPTIPSGAAASKGVDTSISASSTSTNLPTSKAVAAFVEGFVASAGTITGITAGTGLSGGGTSGNISLSLAASGATAGSYGPSAAVTGSDGATVSIPYITVDACGRVTSISNKTYTSKNTTYTALKNPNSLTVQGNGTTSFTYDGSAAKTLNIKPGSNVSVSSDTSGNITINSSYHNTTYTFATGDNNGQIRITSSDGSFSDNVSVKGLGSAAYTATTAYAPASHYQTSNTINAMTGYSKASSASAISASDSLNTAIGKLEKALDGKGTSNLTLGSTATTAAPGNHTHSYIPISEKGTASGVAELDANGKVPTSQLPSYVDDVLEYSAKSSFPTTGETGKIYVDTTTNKTYRWGGSAYVEISASLAIGTTSSTAAAGNHTHSNYANQNAFSYIKVGSTDVAADTITDTLTLVGSNVTLTPDAANDKITIGITQANVTAALGYTPLQTYTNTTYTFATGSTNGTFNVTPSGGSAIPVAIKGLGSAAYTESTAYATAAQGTKADNAFPKTGGSISGAVTLTGTAATTAHLKFSREGYNYITFPSNGHLAFATAATGSDIIIDISPTALSPYSTADKIDLGASDKKWDNVYATNYYGSGANLTSLNASNIGSGTLPSDRLPVVPVAKGGTGAATADQALINLGITTQTSDPGAGSALDKGKIIFVYS